MNATYIKMHGATIKKKNLDFFREILHLNSLEMRPVEAEFFHTDRRTDVRTDRKAGRETEMTKRHFS